MKRLIHRLNQPEKLISIYATAGYPQYENTIEVLETLESSGVDLIEIGMPFSDPLADGPTIQESSSTALANGMTTEKLFDQLQGVRKRISIPLILMGYFNPVLQFGVERFLQKAHEIGIDGIILPDLPLEVYLETYQPLFEKYQLSMIFLITPQTSNERIAQIEAASTSFIYMVSSASTTGAKQGFSAENVSYFKRIHELNLKVPTLVGFGISNKETFQAATTYAHGAIIGSAFINFISKNELTQIPRFIKELTD